jgi:hypothetical protein
MLLVVHELRENKKQYYILIMKKGVNLPGYFRIKKN